MFQIASFKIIGKDSTEILFSQSLLNFFSKLGSAGLNYHLPKLSFFTDPFCAGVSNKHCLLNFHSLSLHAQLSSETRDLIFNPNLATIFCPKISAFYICFID